MVNLLKQISVSFIFLLIALSANSQHHWQGLAGYTFNRYINSLCVDTVRDKLYIGGDFSHVNGLSYNGICQWDGISLQHMTCGVSGCSNICRGITDMVMFKGNLFALYRSDSIGCTPSFSVAEWDGSQWLSLNQSFFAFGTLVYPMSIFSFDSILVVNGMIDSINNLKVFGQVQYDGNVWNRFFHCPLFQGPDFGKHQITNYKGVYYACNLEEDTSGNRQYFSRWNGACWEKVPGAFSTFNMSINKMIVYQDDLYVAGIFTPYSDPQAPGFNIARFDGLQWYDLNGGVTGFHPSALASVRDLTIHNGYLYVVGNFEVAGGIPASNIARWDGNQWCSFGAQFDHAITSVEFFHDTLFIGGAFHTIDSDSIRSIAKWTGGSFIDSCSPGVSVPEIESLIKLSLYPNPANDYLYVSYTTHGNSSLEFSIYNSLGSIVYSRPHMAGRETEEVIDISALSSGLYILQLKTGNEMLSEKFLINR